MEFFLEINNRACTFIQYRRVGHNRCRTKSRKKRPKFAAVDLFPRTCILENVNFELSHEKEKNEAQIRRRWFISTRMYIGKCDILVVARKAEKWGPNSPPLIYFRAHVYWKRWLFSCRTKSRKMRPKFAAADLFPRACILENVTFELSHKNQKKEAQICRRWFISTRKYREEIF